MLFALLALAPIAVVFTIYSPGLFRELSRRGMQDLLSLGRSHISITTLWIEEKIGDVERLAASPPVLDALQRGLQGSEGLSGFLRPNLREAGLQGIYVLDVNGNQIASADKDKQEVPHAELEQLLRKVVKGAHAASACVCRVREKNGKYLMFSIASPVTVEATILGAVIAQVDISQLGRFLLNVTGKRVTHSFLVDKEGMMLACFTPDLASECRRSIGKKLVDPQTGGLTRGVEACVTGKEGFSLQTYTNHEGREVLGVWGWLPELEAGLLVEIDAQEFFDMVTLVKRRLWSLLFITGVSIIVVSVFISRRVSEPLISLSETAKRIASGKLDERTQIKSDDELGELADSLNIMLESIQAKHAELEVANRRLAAASVRDGLTGLYNHYRFQELMESEYQRAKRYGLPLCLLMIDIDNFKSVNDTYGHLFGDFVLKEIARIINKSIRNTDISSRYGGEEFTVILPNTELDGAYAVAEKLRQAVANHIFKYGDSVAKLTLTIGISTLAEEGIHSKDDMVKHADEAMYEGKIRGKNMVISWGEFVLWDRLVPRKEEESAEHYRRRFLSTAENVKRSYMETATALVKTLEAKDGYSATHSYMVATYAVKFAGELKLPPEEVEVIKNSAILHDVGKIAIPDAILKKDGPLTEEEYNIVKMHPQQSVRILEGIRFLERELPIILHHHEWYNGQGYPDGLKGEEIPLGARMLAMCDAYEAMTSERPYHKNLTHKEGLEQIRKEAGGRFDPHLVEPFIGAIERLMATTRRIYIPQLNKVVDIA